MRKAIFILGLISTVNAFANPHDIASENLDCKGSEIAINLDYTLGGQTIYSRKTGKAKSTHYLVQINGTLDFKDPEVEKFSLNPAHEKAVIAPKKSDTSKAGSKTLYRFTTDKGVRIDVNVLEETGRVHVPLGFPLEIYFKGTIGTRDTNGNSRSYPVDCTRSIEPIDGEY